MSVHLQREIDHLKQSALEMCGMVEEQVDAAVRALLNRDPALAKEVVERDAEIDQREVLLEKACLKALAVHQPVASDLRLIVALLKINNDLERIGDLAVNIAHKAKKFSSETEIEIPFDLLGMWKKTQRMLGDSFEALLNLDADLANDVCARDSEVDEMKRESRRKAEELIRSSPEQVTPLVTLLSVSRHLERIADHATNIAEDVIYWVKGRIIRHQQGD